jgi:hypothetical protein
MSRENAIRAWKLDDRSVRFVSLTRTCTGPVTPADTADAASCMRFSSLNDGSPLPRTLHV